MAVKILLIHCRKILHVHIVEHLFSYKMIASFPSRKTFFFETLVSAFFRKGGFIWYFDDIVLRDSKRRCRTRGIGCRQQRFIQRRMILRLYDLSSVLTSIFIYSVESAELHTSALKDLVCVISSTYITYSVYDILSSNVLASPSRFEYIRNIRAGLMMIKQKGFLPPSANLAREAPRATRLNMVPLYVSCLSFFADKHLSIMTLAARKIFEIDQKNVLFHTFVFSSRIKLLLDKTYILLFLSSPKLTSDSNDVSENQDLGNQTTLTLNYVRVYQKHSCPLMKCLYYSLTLLENG